ncbi:uncharacterized protein TNCV_1594221 [Trichonephila clavipes]|nr:uncharacterized protein TNCV_1594221 [Trichonephila clavipes]
MPPNTLRVHTEYVLVKSVGLKVLWSESRVRGTGEYFLPLQFRGKIVEVEIGGVAIYWPFGELRRDNSYCYLQNRNRLVKVTDFGGGPPVGVVWKFEEGRRYQLKCSPRHLTMVQNFEAHRLEPSNS